MAFDLSLLFIPLWLCVIVLGIVVYALARQVGVLHQRLGPAGALMLNQTAKVGAKSPEFDLSTLDNTSIEIGKKRNDGRSTLLMFVSPDCPVCAQLMPALKSIASTESSWMELVFASDGDPEQHRAFRKSKQLNDYSYVLSGELGMSYQIGKLPYAVLLNEEGTVASQGLCNSREHIESLIEAKRMGIASLQDYLAQTHDHNHEHRHDHAHAPARVAE
jgi:methylamine dehydrogenase accessory protein MauD